MAYRRVRRSRRKGTLESMFRGKVKHLGWLVFGIAIIGLGSFFLSLIPSNYIYFGNGTLGVASSLPSGATGIDIKLIVGIVTWAVGGLVTFKAYRGFGIRV